MRMHERMRRHRTNQDLCNMHNKDYTIFPFIMLILISILGGASIVVMAGIYWSDEETRKVTHFKN